MTEQQAETIISVVSDIQATQTYSVNTLQSIDINLQYVGAFILVAVVLYGLVKLVWSFLEPITLD